MKLRILSLAVIASLGAGSALAADHTHRTEDAADPDLERLEVSAKAGNAVAASRLAALYQQSGDRQLQAKALEVLSSCDSQMHPICRVDLGLAYGRQALLDDLDEDRRQQLARQSIFRITHAAHMGNADAVQLLTDFANAGLGGRRTAAISAAQASPEAGPTAVEDHRHTLEVPAIRRPKTTRAAFSEYRKDGIFLAAEPRPLLNPLIRPLEFTARSAQPMPVLVASVGKVPVVPASPAPLELQGLQGELDQAMEQLQVARMQLEESNRTITALREQMQATQAPASAFVDAAALNRKALDAAMSGDYETAIPMFRKASELNHAGAINNLAAMFVNGTGVARDMQQAVNLFERAAQLGNAEAAENAARIYNYGIGRGKDPSRARTWYRKAIELGSVRAAQELADMERNIEADVYFKPV
ncbi:sel1 repeat family protein [Xanthomonas perforans]|uniref:Sel1 repeat family protein n=1 Tax=Xanthomonas perforans TaxID=442694 RepID=A0A6L9VUX0_XANPE|nr:MULTISPECIES: tetratricopeptide repeat protein [Xanthomonas]MBZ2413703.1 sel1 repeat family protein [Xanthomonas perforans]MBZ2422097.1 sel1 repeat family protein [Xanthomonas perforans]MBZ2426445.1 sel1 repeat family protein [Xanthomonas perforans]MBZ2430901.1 sel1 repeat family protein [Xanthomonas perforans]MBZ2448653.1 sel1 repeat family protein [Xanthomonas perforans]